MSLTAMMLTFARDRGPLTMNRDQASPEWRRAAADTDLPLPALARAFEKEVRRQEDILYGVALFHEGMSLLCAGQKAVVETHRRQFRNIIRAGKQVCQWARTLLEEARKEPRKARLLREFEFLPYQDHPNPDALILRAQIMIETYEQLYPGRNRHEPLKQEELLRLMEKAGAKLPDNELWS